MTIDEATAIHQRLDRFDDKLTQIADAVTRQTTVWGLAQGKLDGMCEAMYGNGREGLLSRVARLETVRKIWASAAAAIVGLLSGIAVSLVSWWLNK